MGARWLVSEGEMSVGDTHHGGAAGECQGALKGFWRMKREEAERERCVCGGVLFFREQEERGP